MSSNCGNCDCSNKSQCGNKRSEEIIETIVVDTIVMDVEASENDGKCKCGSSCSCTNCGCGGH